MSFIHFLSIEERIVTCICDAYLIKKRGTEKIKERRKCDYQSVVFYSKRTDEKINIYYDQKAPANTSVLNSYDKHLFCGYFCVMVDMGDPMMN